MLIAIASAALALLAWLAACSSQPSSAPAETAKPEPKGPELLTGRSGFQKSFYRRPRLGPRRTSLSHRIHRHHRRQTATMVSGPSGAPASPLRTQRAVKSFVWSGSAATDAPARGINPSTEDGYNPSNASTQVFDAAFLKIDSDQAVATAQKHGGDKILEKSPDTPVTYHLRLEPQHQPTDLARNLRQPAATQPSSP
jgi:hypothetical protein